MSKKIVYFLEAIGEVKDTKKIIPDILERMPKECGVETYFINLSGKEKAKEKSEEVIDFNNVTDENGFSEESNLDEITSEEKNISGEISNFLFDSNDNQTMKLSENIEEAAEDEEESEQEKGAEIKEASEKAAEERASESEKSEENLQDVVETTSTLKFMPLEDCDFSEFKDATFIVPINYLFFLLSYISDYKEAKICPYIYDSKCISYFLNQIKNPNMSEIDDMFNSTESCLFINKSNAVGWDYGIDQFGDCVIPVSTDLCAAGYAKKSDFNPNVIKIAWIGAISKTAFECITRICEDLYKTYGVDENGEKQNIHMFDFHILGLGSIIGQFNFKKFCPLIRFVIPGGFNGEDLDRYMCSHIDLAAGYNMNAVEAALCGIPTIIPAIDDEPVLAKRTYVYFADAKSYVLCWKKSELRSLAYDDYTIGEVIERLKNEKTRKKDSERCLEYATSSYTYEENAKRIVAYTDRSSLTVERLLETPSVAKVMKQLDDYRASSEEHANATYYDYFNRNKKH